MYPSMIRPCFLRQAGYFLKLWTPAAMYFVLVRVLVLNRRCQQYWPNLNFLSRVIVSYLVLLFPISCYCFLSRVIVSYLVFWCLNNLALNSPLGYGQTVQYHLINLRLRCNWYLRMHPSPDHSSSDPKPSKLWRGRVRMNMRNHTVRIHEYMCMH